MYFLYKKTSIIQTFSKIRTMDRKSSPQRVNSYKLLYYGLCSDQVNSESRSDEFAQKDKSHLVWAGWWAMQAQSPYTKQLICKRCTEEHNHLFEGFNNYREHEDLFYFILYSSYCLLHLRNGQRCFKNCAVACFVLQKWFVYVCMYVADMCNFECYSKTVSLYCELINLNAV